MSILIHGMEMPKSCAECKLSTRMHHGELVCKMLNTYADDLCLESDCPLIEVPEHGRLIDADSFKDTLDYYIREAEWGDDVNKVLGWVKDEFIDSEQTIIPADKESEK